VSFQAPVLAVAGILFGLLSASRKQAKARSERGLMSSAPPAAKGAAPPPHVPAPATPTPAPFFLTRWWLSLRGGRTDKLTREGAPPRGGAPAPRADNAVAVENPLLHATPATAAGEPPANDNTWTRHSDGHGDVWFTNASGGTAWELPPGAVLAGALEVAPAAEDVVVWRRFSAGRDVWYRSSAGETALALPPGAVLAPPSPL
jgi:hypothetical protein